MNHAVHSLHHPVSRCHEALSHAGREECPVSGMTNLRAKEKPAQRMCGRKSGSMEHLRFGWDRRLEHQHKKPGEVLIAFLAYGSTQKAREGAANSLCRPSRSSFDLRFAILAYGIRPSVALIIA